MDIHFSIWLYLKLSICRLLVGMTLLMGHCRCGANLKRTFTLTEQKLATGICFVLNTVIFRYTDQGLPVNDEKPIWVYE